MQPRKRFSERPRRADGFTIVEVLVAMALFAIVVLVILAPLTGLFGLTQRSTQQVGATNTAQQVLEQIRGQWLDQVKYSKSCADLTVPAGVTVTTTVQDKNALGNAVGSTYSVVIGCSAAAVRTVPNIRFLTVAATATAGTATGSSSLSVEVARP